MPVTPPANSPLTLKSFPSLEGCDSDSDESPSPPFNRQHSFPPPSYIRKAATAKLLAPFIMRYQAQDDSPPNFLVRAMSDSWAAVTRRVAGPSMPFHHETIVLFNKHPPLSELQEASEDKKTINIREAFGFDVGILEKYEVDSDKQLEAYGLIERGKVPVIGRLALSPNVGDVRLSAPVIALQIALTITHQISRTLQYQVYPVVTAMDGELSEEAKNAVDTAKKIQDDLLEALAYQTQLHNLTCYQELHKKVLQPDELNQLKALENSIMERRDKHFEALPPDIKKLVSAGAILSALEKVHSNVSTLAPQRILQPLAEAEEEGNEA